MMWYCYGNVINEIVKLNEKMKKNINVINC